MRKDLRVGLGIGGVLLAVMIVALVVRSHNKQHRLAQGDANLPTQAEGVDPSSTDAVPPTPDPTVAPPATDAGATPPAVTPAPPPRAPIDPVFGDPSIPGGSLADATTASTPPAASSRSTDWEKLLATGNMEAPRPAAPPAPVAPPPVRVADAPRPAGNGLLEPTPPITGPTVRGGPANVGGNRASSTNAPARAARAGAGKTYTVRDGDTMSTIAREVYGSKRYYLQIAKANPSVNPGKMKIGTVLALPEINTASADAPGTNDGPTPAAHGNIGRSAPAVALDSRRQYRVESGDSLCRIAQKLYGVQTKADALYDANRATIGPDKERLKIGMLLKLPEPPTIASR